jgi:hypothetical protein
MWDIMTRIIFAILVRIQLRHGMAGKKMKSAPK